MSERTVEELTLAMPGGVKIVVPDDLNVATTYVLLEQQDWFEAEIRFVRAFARPGMRAIDAGANFGVYTLALAGRAGAGGRVWAIEPAAEAARFLARSIAVNGYTSVELVQCALSSSDGRGFLDTAADPELRRLVTPQQRAEPGGSHAATEIRTLDSLAAERAIGQVDFVKIDVEGEEANVLAGGEGFLAREDPLIMLEFKSEKHVNADIFAALARIEYDTFRLVPGIGVLAPFYESEEADTYLINLFACRRSRAAMLESAGFLAADPARNEPAFAATPALDMLFERPFASSHARRWLEWARAARTGSDREYLAALSWYLAAHERANSAAARCWAIEQAYLRLRAQLRARYTPACAASFVRVAADYGCRAEAVAVGRRLVASIAQGDGDAFEVPLLAPWPYHETIAADPDPRAWLLASALESYEHLYQFSSYFKPALAHVELGVEPAARFLSPAYARRRELFERRARTSKSSGQ